MHQLVNKRLWCMLRFEKYWNQNEPMLLISGSFIKHTFILQCQRKHSTFWSRSLLPCACLFVTANTNSCHMVEQQQTVDILRIFCNAEAVVIPSLLSLKNIFRKWRFYVIYYSLFVWRINRRVTFHITLITYIWTRYLDLFRNHSNTWSGRT